LVVAAAARLAEKPTAALKLHRKSLRTVMEVLPAELVAAAAAALAVQQAAGLLLGVELLPQGSAAEFSQIETD
jgi:hypothetical protein